MNLDFKSTFLSLWKKYFGNAELPIVFYYTEGTGGAEWEEIPKGRSCIICELATLLIPGYSPHPSSRKYIFNKTAFINYNNSIYKNIVNPL